jgi:hypothetical protein
VGNQTASQSKDKHSSAFVIFCRIVNMPPNVQPCWERITARHNRLEDEDEELLVRDSVIVKPPSLQEENPSDAGRILWEARLALSTTGFLDDDHSETVSLTVNPTLVDALSSIIVLDDATKKQDWLSRHNGSLSDVSFKLLQGLRYVIYVLDGFPKPQRCL